MSIVNVGLEKSDLGDTYKNMYVEVDNNKTMFYNVHIDNVIDILNDAVFEMQVAIRELLNEEFETVGKEG